MPQPSSASDLTHEFLRKSRSLLVSDYLPKIERSVACLNDEEVWARPNEASNSIGNLLLHLRGNVTQWIIAGVGGRSRERHRQQEFDERSRIPAKDLVAGLRAAVEEADQVIGGVDAGALLKQCEIQDYQVTVLSEGGCAGGR